MARTESYSEKYPNLFSALEFLRYPLYPVAFIPKTGSVSSSGIPAVILRPTYPEDTTGSLSRGNLGLLKIGSMAIGRNAQTDKS